MAINPEKRLTSLICSYVASGLSAKEIISRIRSATTSKTIFGHQPDGTIPYYFTPSGVAKFLKDQGKEDEALYVDSMGDVEAQAKIDKELNSTAKMNVDLYKQRHPIASFFKGKKGLDQMKTDKIAQMKAKMQARKDDVAQDKALKAYGKETLSENNIKQFFLDSGFMAQPGMPEIGQLFPDEPKTFSSVQAGFEDGFDPQGDSEEYAGIPDNIKDNLYKDAAGKVVSFSDYFMFNDPAADPDRGKFPYSKTRPDLNFVYRPKDFVSTHSFSDIRLEDLEQPAQEFPRHVGSRTTVEGGQITPPEEENNGY